MAGSTNTVAEIDQAVASLTEALKAKFVNFFDRTTLQELDCPRGNLRYVIVTGTYAYGEWRYGDNVRLVCMTEHVEGTLWSYVAEKLKLKDSIKLPTNGVMELSSPAFSRTNDGGHGDLAEFVKLSGKDKAGCKFYLHYCAIPPPFHPTDMRLKMIPGYSNSQRAAPEYFNPNFQTLAVQRNLDMVRDMQHLAIDTLWKRDQFVSIKATEFVEAYRNLRCWAKANGLFGPELGFLDSQSIMWIAHGAYMEHWPPQASKLLDEDGDTLLKTVLKRFESELQVQSTEEDYESINFDIYTPTKRLISGHLTQEAKQAIYNAIRLTENIEDVDGAILMRPEGRFREFLEDFDLFYRINCECWAPTLAAKAEFEEHTVPDNINAIAKHFRKKHGQPELGGLCIRLWPVPFEEKRDGYSKSTYAIGLRRLPRSPYISEPMKACADTIADYIVENCFDYDTTKGLITIRLASSEDFGSLLQKVIDDGGALEPDSPMIVQPSARETTNSGRFRTAGQAISRLRYDPAHTAVEYDLGYEDRFEGTILMPLEEWGGKATEMDDFIPEHRVRILKRRKDGLVVWDRHKRLDLTGA